MRIKQNGMKRTKSGEIYFSITASDFSGNNPME